MKRRRFAGLAAAFCYAPQRLRAQPLLPVVTSTHEAAWAREWQQLRPLCGHFDGAPWNDTVDRWQGRKHQLMLALAGSLVQRQASERDVLQLLGRPDRLLRSQDPAYAQVAGDLRPLPDHTNPARPALWLYRWRGSHDQMALSVHSGRARAASWLSAHE